MQASAADRPRGLSLVDRVMELGAVQRATELLGLVQFLEGYGELHNVLEIGVETGATFFAWCHLFDGKKVALDLPSGNSGSGRYTDPHALNRRNEAMTSWADDVHIIIGDSHEASSLKLVKKVLGKQRLDMLFVDGDHTKEGAAADVRMYSPLVREGGLLVMHDIKDSQWHRDHGCYVGSVWRGLVEAAGNRVHREFVDMAEWGGIGVLEL